MEVVGPMGPLLAEVLDRRAVHRYRCRTRFRLEGSKMAAPRGSSGPVCLVIGVVVGLCHPAVTAGGGHLPASYRAFCCSAAPVASAALRDGRWRCSQ